MNGRRVRPDDLPPTLPVTFNEVLGTSMLHVTAAVATRLTGAPMAGVRAAATGGLRFVALPNSQGVGGIYRCRDGSVSPVLTLLHEEANELATHLEEQSGKAPEHAYILFLHGEADRSTPAADYQRQFKEARALIDEGLAGHGLRARWLLTQAAGTSARGDGNAWQSRIAVMDALEDDPTLTFAGPLYPYPLHDHIHYNALAKAMIGELCAHIIAALEAGQTWAPLLAPIVRLSGQTITLDCAAPEPLVLDKTVAAAFDLRHYGFTVEDGPKIASVRQEGDATLVIELESAPVKPFHLRYAYRRTSRAAPEELRPFAFAQGAVRTEWGLASEIAPGETLRKWLPAFITALQPTD